MIRRNGTGARGTPSWVTAITICERSPAKRIKEPHDVYRIAPHIVQIKDHYSVVPGAGVSAMPSMFSLATSNVNRLLAYLGLPAFETLAKIKPPISGNQDSRWIFFDRLPCRVRRTAQASALKIE